MCPAGYAVAPGGKRCTHQGDKIVAGRGNYCRLGANGEARCWGTGLYGAILPPAGVTWADISPGLSSSCGVERTTGRVLCWGQYLFSEEPIAAPATKIAGDGNFVCAILRDNLQGKCFGYGASQPPKRAPLHEVIVGDSFACGLRVDDGRAFCWGEAAVDPPSGLRFASITSGEDYACGVSLDDAGVTCWGGDASAVPEPPIDLPKVSQVSAFEDLGCATASDSGRVTCWSSNPFSRDDDPPQDAFDQVALSYGGCGVTRTGTTRCWGLQIDGGDFPPPDYGYVDISPAHQYACAIRSTDRGIECWGEESLGNHDAPKGVRFSDLSVDTYTGCAIREDNKQAECWGNYPGLPIPRDVRLSAITTGYNHSCGIRADNQQAICWYGSGPGGEGLVNAPVGVRFSDISADRNATCGVRIRDGHPQCWGYSPAGDEPPVALSRVAVGDRHACGIRGDDGHVVCWGQNESGEATPPAGMAFKEIAAFGEEARRQRLLEKRRTSCAICPRASGSTSRAAARLHLKRQTSGRHEAVAGMRMTMGVGNDRQPQGTRVGSRA